MEQYFSTVALLGLNDGNLPPHRGMREKRYQSVEKILDLLDVIKRIGPKFPVNAMFLDPSDPEWDDNMTYLYVDYPFYKKYIMAASVVSLFFLYNYNIMFHNRNMAFVTKTTLGMLFYFSNRVYFKYRNQVLRCNLFDEYVQMRADELVKEREHLLRGEDMKRWIYYSADLKETLTRCHRQAFRNDASDFKDAELLLQDFIRRYSDDTQERPLSSSNARIGF